MKHFAGSLFGVVLGAVLVQPAVAAVIGDTVTCSTSTGSITPCSAASSVVGQGPEFFFTFFGSNSYSVDFDNGNFILSTLSGNFRNATTYYFENLTNPITGYSVTSISNITSFDASKIGLSNGVLSIALDNSVVSFQGQNIVLALSGAPVAVPEPAAWTVFAAGLALMTGLALRRHGATRSLAAITTEAAPV